MFVTFAASAITQCTQSHQCSIIRWLEGEAQVPKLGPKVWVFGGDWQGREDAPLRGFWRVWGEEGGGNKELRV